MELVAVALHGLLYVGTEHIVASGEERCKRTVVGQLSCGFQRSALYPDDGFLFPFLAEENEVSQQLFGGVRLAFTVPIIAFSGQFPGEVQRESLQRTDAVVVIDVELSEALCGRFGDGVDGTARHTNE